MVDVELMQLSVGLRGWWGLRPSITIVISAVFKTLKGYDDTDNQLIIKVSFSISISFSSSLPCCCRVK